MAPNTANDYCGAYTNAEHDSDMPASLYPAAVLVATVFSTM